MCMLSFFSTFLTIVAVATATQISDANAELPTPFILIEGAAARGAVCLDGSTPGYYFLPGYGSGANNWLVDFEGGGWCEDIKSCLERKTTFVGTSTMMRKNYTFDGILNSRAQFNPDFYNWNRARAHYCDGASFAGDSENKDAGLQFRGQRIYRALIDELLSRGMRRADQVLLSGGSAGGVAVILHCDDFANMFPPSTRVKCLSDAGLFMDTKDVYGGHDMRKRVHGVVTLHGVQKMLPRSCTSRLDADSCFFPQYLINYVRTPMFILNAAYDVAQIQAGIAPNISGPEGKWNNGCRENFAKCSASQIQVIQKFRKHMLKAVKGFGAARRNGLFINACFAHCQTDNQTFWLSNKAPRINNKGISRAVGDWFFQRSKVKEIGTPYPHEKTCPSIV